jgi:general nucleoside transport system permease protein
MPSLSPCWDDPIPAAWSWPGYLFGALRAGGQTMQVRSEVGIDLIVIVQALVIVFIAAPALVRAIYRVRTGEGAGQLTRGWSV